MLRTCLGGAGAQASCLLEAACAAALCEHTGASFAALHCNTMCREAVLAGTTLVAVPTVPRGSMHRMVPATAALVVLAAVLLPCPAATQTCGNIDALGAGRATGKGSANDAPALQRMDADGSTGLIYLPPGRYRIASSLTLRKPLFGESGAVLVVDGVTLTLLAQPEHPRVKLFEIQGACCRQAHAWRGSA